MTPTLLLLVSFLTDFIITSGSIISGAMLATKEVTMPNQAVIILALISGVVVAARRAQALIQPSQTDKPPDVEALVTKLAGAIRAGQPVTPLRVDAEPKPVKDSS